MAGPSQRPLKCYFMRGDSTMLLANGIAHSTREQQAGASCNDCFPAIWATSLKGRNWPNLDG